jgi:hypothetical protein
MKYNLRKPCANCPFRTDIDPYLNDERAREIVDSLVRGEFPCHKTLDYSHDDEDGEARNTQKTAHCAGALIMLEHDEQPGQMMRIMERIGGYDRRLLDMESPVFKRRADFIRAQPKFIPRKRRK